MMSPDEDFSNLFEITVRKPAHPTIADELEAVAGLRKGISVHVLSGDQLDEIGSFKQTARHLNLVTQVVTETLDAVSEVLLFAYRPEQSWRVNAYLWSRSTLFRYGCSDGLEALTSRILGYSEEQFSEWIAHHRAGRIGWAGPTRLLLMSRQQRQDLVALYGRVLPKDCNPPIICFYSLNQRHVLRPDAQDCIGDRFLVRASFVATALSNEFESVYARRRKADVLAVACTLEMVDQLNNAMTSPVQFRVGEQWLDFETFKNRREI